MPFHKNTRQKNEWCLRWLFLKEKNWMYQHTKQKPIFFMLKNKEPRDV